MKPIYTFQAMRYFLIILFFTQLLLAVSCQNSTNPGSEFSASPEDSLIATIEDQNTIVDSISDVRATDIAESPAIVDSTAIGKIKIGCSKQEFNKFKKEFLERNPSLEGIQIEQFRGFFYEGKLIRVIIISEKYEVMAFWDTDSNRISRLHEPWKDLYKKKYHKNITPEEGVLIGNDAITIDKGACRICVSDDALFSRMPSSFAYDFDPSFAMKYITSSLDKKLLLEQHAISSTIGSPSRSFHYPAHSMIQIYDRNKIESLKNAYKASEEIKENTLKSHNHNDI